MATTAGKRAELVDASVTGARLSHSTPLADDTRSTIACDWQGVPIEFVAERRWTRTERDGYQSGYEIQSIDVASSAAWRGLIDACAARMPVYERHEIVHGVWRTTQTTDGWQPDVGFTVRSTESPHAVAFFRAAYSRGDAKMRQRIRNLAASSIAHPERFYGA